MPDGRPPIPRGLARDVRVEAGHRCAIPTCLGIAALQIAHIEPWARVREHSFANLILLCAVCHHRFDHGEIDRPSMRAYKANLGLLTSRYGDLERRVFELFAAEPDREHIDLPGPNEILLLYAVRDGLLRMEPRPDPPPGVIAIIGSERYYLTEAGRAFVSALAEGHPAS